MSDPSDYPPPTAPRLTGTWPTHVATYETGDPGEETFSMEVFHATSAARGYRAAETQSRSVSEETTERVRAAAGALLFETHRDHQETVVLDWDDCCLHLKLDRSPTANSWLRIYAAGREIASVRKALEKVQKLLPTASPGADDGCIDVRFWMGGPYESAARIERRLTAPRWQEVSANYPASTRRELEATMSDLEALAARGRMLLWHGPPGTGKTFAVRAMAREHRNIATIDCIVEPELFFSKGAHYLTELMAEEIDPEDERWHVLVVEDADELISADAKLRSGQGLSRLLNLADGLFGQAIRVLVVVTTNEPITSFHPAIVRPGRCGSLVSFQRFAADEAQEWLRRAGSGEAVSGPATLAELYARIAGAAPLRSVHEVGFHVPTPDQRERDGTPTRPAPDPRVRAGGHRPTKEKHGISDEEAERLADLCERLGPEDFTRVRPGPAAHRGRRAK
jgi:hypothetical protein